MVLQFVLQVAKKKKIVENGSKTEPWDTPKGIRVISSNGRAHKMCKFSHIFNNTAGISQRPRAKKIINCGYPLK